MNQILYSGKTKKNIEFNINNKIIIIIAITLITFLIFLLSTIFAFINRNNTNILSNIYIQNVNLSDLSKENAIIKLQNELIAPDIPDFLNITINDTQYKIDSTKLQINFDYEATANEAYNIGRNSNFIKNNYIILKTTLFGSKSNPICNIDKTSFDNLVKELEDNLNIDNIATEQSYEIIDNTLYVTKGSDGYSIDKEFLKNQLSIAYSNNDFTALSTNIIQKTADEIDIDKLYNNVHTEAIDAQKIEKDGVIIFSKSQDGITFDVDYSKELVKASKTNTIEIPLITTKPSITNEMVMADMFNDVLSTYTTSFDITNTNRTENIKLALNKINGTILLPEDEFSFNNIVGNRTELAGFKLATVYSNGKIEEGIGGGVCQVSSTLYNAALLCNIPIIERNNHTYQVSYVPLGQDATVSYGLIDLKFKNNRLTPIKIVGEINENNLNIHILGTKSIEDSNIKIENIITKTTPFIIKETEIDTLNKGKTNITQKGMNGYTIETYKILNNNDSNKELISTSTYLPLEQLVEIGTKVTNNKKPNKNNSGNNSNIDKPNPPQQNPEKPTTPEVPTTPEPPYVAPTLPPGWDVPENPYN